MSASQPPFVGFDLVEMPRRVRTIDMWQRSPPPTHRYAAGQKPPGGQARPARMRGATHRRASHACRPREENGMEPFVLLVLGLCLLGLVAIR
jgi:hypothetical protein